MKNKKIFLALIAILIAVAVSIGIVAARVVPKVNHSLRIGQLLQPLLDAPNQGMRMAVQGTLEGKSFQVDSRIYRIREAETDYLVLERNGHAVYFANHALFLENGKAFAIGDSMKMQPEEFEELLSRIGSLFGLLDITATQTDARTTYAITVTGEQVDALLAAASLGQELPVEDLQKLELQLTEQNGVLETIVLFGGGDLKGASASVQITLSDFQVLDAGAYAIPTPVRQQAATVNPQELFSLTEDLYRLALALAPLAEQMQLDGTLELAVNCGLLQLDTRVNLADLNSASLPEADSEMLKALPEMLGWMCMEGQLRCTVEDNGYLYELVLDQGNMQDLVSMILPEVAGYADFLTEGKVQIRLENGRLESMGVSVAGKIPALITQIPVTIQAAFLFS